MSLLAVAQPDGDRKSPVYSSPEEHAGLTAAYLSTIPEHDRPYIKTFSFWDMEEEDKNLIRNRRFLPWWINQMTFVRSPHLPVEVPGSKGKLFAIDIRELGWSIKAWETVATRDPFSREPVVTYPVAETLRKVSYTRAPELDKNNTRPLLVMINANWFIRETLESDRSDSYYDLLFSHIRHPDGGTNRSTSSEPKTEMYQVEETVYEERQDYFNGFLRTYRVPVKKLVTKTRTVSPTTSNTGTKGNANFPATIEELEKALFIDRFYQAAEESSISMDFGSIAAGGRNHRNNGSIVALGDRLIVVVPGPFGWFMRTYDAFKNVGDRDYSEVLFFRGGKFRRGDRAEAKFDAGEILYYLPNGGMGGMLIDGEGKRAEIAAQRAAQNRKDPILNIGVRNVWDCLTCHAPTGGFIPPRDIETRDREAGIKRQFYIPTFEGYLQVYPKADKEEYLEHVRKGKEKEVRYREFFDDWMIRSKGQTEMYELLIARTTKYKEEQEWTGVDIARVIAELVSEYDDEVTLARSSRYLGIPDDALKYLCNKSPAQRDKQLLRGITIPIDTYEVDAYHRLGLLLDASRSDELLRQIYPNLPFGGKP